MNFSTWRRSYLPSSLALLVCAFMGLATGCQSAKSGFSFQPVPTLRAAPVEKQAEPIAARAETAELMPVASSAQPVSRPAARPRRTRTSPQRHAEIVASPLPSHAAQTRMPQHRRALFVRPHATAERGLGTTVLGVLGLIALPIALVGLLLSGGGLVWAIVAGAAALAVLVAYLDPFGH